MRLTFAAALSSLDAAQAFPVDADVTKRKSLLNQGLEAAILSGRFNGTEVPIQIRARGAAEITLPRQFQTIKGVKINGTVRDLASPWYSYLQGTSDATQWSRNVVDRGDGYATFAQPMGLVNGVLQSVPAKLRVVSTGAPVTGVGSSIEVHGVDASGMEVWNGAQRGAVLTFAAVKAAPYFSVIREVIKPVTTQLAYLYACYDDATEEVIGIFEPGETVPSYRKYFVPELAQTTAEDLADTPVDALCQLRHIPLVADNDIVPITNFRALKNLVLSVYWEDEGDEVRSKNHLDTAIAFLNSENGLLRPPSEQAAFRVNAQGCGAVGLKALR